MDLSFDENDIIVYSPVGSEELEEEIVQSSENIIGNIQIVSKVIS